MKKLISKKKLLFLISSLIVLFFIYVGWNVYQSNQMEIISIKDIHSLEVSTSGELTNDTVITGETIVADFEAVALVDRMVVDETLYIIIYKWPAFKQENKIAFNLENTPSLNRVTKISIVYGDIYSGEGEQRGISYNELATHPEQEIIWEIEH